MASFPCDFGLNSCLGDTGISLKVSVLVQEHGASISFAGGEGRNCTPVFRWLQLMGRACNPWVVSVMDGKCIQSHCHLQCYQHSCPSLFREAPYGFETLLLRFLQLIDSWNLRPSIQEPAGSSAVSLERSQEA